MVSILRFHRRTELGVRTIGAYELNKVERAELRKLKDRQAALKHRQRTGPKVR